MATITQSIQPITSIVDINGDPISGGKLKFFEAGTSTPKDVWTTPDKTGGTNVTEITLDTRGMPASQVFGDGFYKVELEDSSATLLRTFDNVQYEKIDGLEGDLLPIDTVTEVPTDLSANLGSATFRWDELHVREAFIGTSLSDLNIGAQTLQDVVDDLPIYGDFLPLDNGTKLPTDLAGSLGDAVTRWNGAYIAADITDGVGDVYYKRAEIDSLVEANVFDSNASDEIVFQTDTSVADGSFLINTTFNKVAADKIVRFTITGAEEGVNPDMGEWKLIVGTLNRTYRIVNKDNAVLTDWFDITGLADGVTTIQIQWLSPTSTNPATASGGIFKNGF